MKKTIILLIILIVAAAAAWFLYQKFNSQSDSKLETPDPSKEIEVFLPTQETKISGTKFVIYGKGRAFENTINYRVSDGNRKQLYVGSFMTSAPDAGIFGYFHQEIDLTKILSTVPDKIILAVMEISAKDGEDIHKTTWELDLQQNSTSFFSYYLNNNLDPEITCQKTYSVARTSNKTQTPLKTSIEELLKGPAHEELEAGFYTSINSGVKLNSAKIENNIAYLDFDSKLDEGVAGSCLVTSIRQQIETTAKQFPTVKEVVISINDRVEPILQP